MLSRLLPLVAAVSLGCTSDTLDSDPTDDTDRVERPEPDRPPVDPNLVIPPVDAEGCHGIYAQDVFPTFELDIAPEEWAGLLQEWEDGVVNETLEDEGEIDDYNPYHPAERFGYGDIEIHDAQVRLRGNPNWWQSQNKLQLQISFNEVRRGGRFLGLRKLALDAATFNRSFLRDRLALASLRDAGIVAPCANHARVVINGEYYGLYTSIEKVDKEFLQSRFEDPEGDLWKRAGWALKTNEDTSDDTRRRAALDAESVSELADWVDLATARTVYATEAVIPDSDGIWGGGLNWYIYDDPVTERFIVIPWDLDNSFWRLPYDTDPVTWHKTERFHGRPWYDVMLADPDEKEAYVSELARVRRVAYDPDVMSARIDAWSAQIEAAAFADPNKPMTNARYLSAREEIRVYIRDRAAFLDEWLAAQ